MAHDPFAQFLSLAETAACLGCSRAVVRRLVETGDIGPCWRGDRVVFETAEVEALAQERAARRSLWRDEA